MSIDNFTILLFFFVEVAAMTYFEFKIWKTPYTPLNILMLPYTTVLLITLLMPKSIGFCDFYYPSIFLWIVGLFIFFIPSFLFGMKEQKSIVLGIDYEKDYDIKPLFYIINILLFFFFIHILTATGSSSEKIGSDEFAESELSGGLWGHIRESLLAGLILLIFLFNKKNWYYIFTILGILVVAMLDQVKSWIIIPLVAGFIYRLYTNTMKLKPLFVILFILGGAGIFFLSYYLLMVYTGDEEFTFETFDLIFYHFLHYLTSGLNGLSVDMQAGFLEISKPEFIFAPFLNIYNLVTQNEMITPISEVYHDSGVSATNVLTIFGTIYVHLGVIGGIFYVLTLSSMLYWLKRYIIFTKCIFATGIYAWWCGLIFMGWFEFYFWNFSALEVPFFFIIYKFINNTIKTPSLKLK